MTTPPHDQSIIDMRRVRVAQLKLRGLSSREIALALAQGDAKGNGRIVNPHTNKPYDQKVILSDLKALKEEWKAARGEATDAHIDRQFTEIQEIKRAAWSTNDPELALKALIQEMNLLGTKAAQELNINFNIEVVMRLAGLIEQRGDNPTQWFMEMIQDFENADSEEVQAAQGLINAHSNTG